MNEHSNESSAAARFSHVIYFSLFPSFLPFIFLFFDCSFCCFNFKSELLIFLFALNLDSSRNGEGWNEAAESY